jgi:hypothetical protein
MIIAATLAVSAIMMLGAAIAQAAETVVIHAVPGFASFAVKASFAGIRASNHAAIAVFTPAAHFVLVDMVRFAA